MSWTRKRHVTCFGQSAPSICLSLFNFSCKSSQIQSSHYGSAVCKLLSHAMASFLHLSGRERISCIYWTLATPFLGWFSRLIQSFAVFCSLLQSFAVFYSLLQSFTVFYSLLQLCFALIGVKFWQKYDLQSRKALQKNHTHKISHEWRGSRNTSDFGPLPSFHSNKVILTIMR